MIRRTTTRLAMLGAGLTVSVAARSGSSAGKARRRPADHRAPSRAAHRAGAPSVTPSAASSEAPQSGGPSLAVPSFALPSDDKGSDALLPGEILGAKVPKLKSVQVTAGDRNGYGYFNGDATLVSAKDGDAAAVALKDTP